MNSIEIKDQGLEWLIGIEVQADHPQTCLNPSKTFRVHEARIDENGRLFVRGEETMWFHGGLISLFNKEPSVGAVGAVGAVVSSDALLACMDMLHRLTDRCGMIMRGVAEQTELFGLVDEAKEILKPNVKNQILSEAR